MQNLFQYAEIIKDYGTKNAAGYRLLLAQYMKQHSICPTYKLISIQIRLSQQELSKMLGLC